MITKIELSKGSTANFSAKFEFPTNHKIHWFLSKTKSQTFFLKFRQLSETDT